MTRNFPAGRFLRFVAVADFRNDGRQDLVVTGWDSNPVSVYAGIGDGSFQEARTFTAGNAPYSVAVGDFNGDGRLDLTVANSNSNNVSLLINNSGVTK